MDSHTLSNSCHCRPGCIVYIVSLMVNVGYLLATYFQSRLIIRHKFYEQSYTLMWAATFGGIIVASYGMVITKVRLKHPFYLISLCIFSGLFFLIGIAAVVCGSQLNVLSTDAIIKNIRQQYAQGHDAMADIQEVYKCCGINNYTDWREVIFANWGRNIDDNEIIVKSNVLEVDENTVEVHGELPDVVSSCCRASHSCGNHLFVDFGLEALMKSRHKDHMRTEDNITHVHYGPDMIVPSLQDIIYTQGCLKHIQKMARIAYDSIFYFGIGELVMLALIVLTCGYYYYGERKLEDHLMYHPTEDPGAQIPADVKQMTMGRGGARNDLVPQPQPVATEQPKEKKKPVTGLLTLFQGKVPD